MNAGNDHSRSKKVDALKRAIVATESLWGTPATTESINDIVEFDSSHVAEIIDTLTEGKFLTRSIKGLEFASFDQPAVEATRAILSSLETAAAVRAIQHPRRASKYNFAAMAVAVDEAMRQGDAVVLARFATGMLSSLFDIADLPDMAAVHRRHSSEAMVYAWAARLDEEDMRLLAMVAQRFARAMDRKSLNTAKYAGRIREIGGPVARKGIGQEAA